MLNAIFVITLMLDDPAIYRYDEDRIYFQFGHGQSDDDAGRSVARMRFYGDTCADYASLTSFDAPGGSNLFD